MKLHCGKTSLPVRLTTVLPAIRSKIAGRVSEYRTYRHNHVLALYGISFGEWLFIGSMKMSGGVHEESRVKLDEDTP